MQNKCCSVVCWKGRDLLPWLRLRRRQKNTPPPGPPDDAMLDWLWSVVATPQHQKYNHIYKHVNHNMSTSEKNTKPNKEETQLVHSSKRSRTESGDNMNQAANTVPSSSSAAHPQESVEHINQHKRNQISTTHTCAPCHKAHQQCNTYLPQHTLCLDLSPLCREQPCSRCVQKKMGAECITADKHQRGGATSKEELEKMGMKQEREEVASTSVEEKISTLP